MMKRAVRWGMSVAVFTSTAVGCANVKVHKVDVQERIHGCDDHVKGFRYYLTRPYLVVAKSIPVTTAYVPVAIGAVGAVLPPNAKLNADEVLPAGAELVLVAQVPDPHSGQFQVFDLAGHPRPEIRLADVQILKSSGSPALNLSTDGKADPESVSKTTASIVDILMQELVKIVAPPGGKFGETDDAEARKGLKLAVNDPGILPDLSNPDTYKTAKEKLAQFAIDAAKKFLKDKGKKPDDLKLDAKSVADKASSPTFSSPSSGKQGAAAAKAVATLVKPAADNAPVAPAKGSDGTKQPSDPPPIQVVFLPDFEEQYAIQNCNVLAKTKYAYKFRNGTDLETFSGDYNATDLPVAIVETVGRLVQAVGGVAQTRANPSAPASAAARLDLSAVPKVDFYLKLQQTIEPGVYRVQKAWERAAAAAEGLKDDQVCGLFADVGLTLVESVAVITSKQYEAENPDAGPPGGN